MKTRRIGFFVLFLALLSLSAFAAGPDTIVYLTDSGKKYHTKNCSSLRISKISIKLGDAITAGYGPCELCKPPTLTSAESKAKETSGALYRVNVENLASSHYADTKRMTRAKVLECIDGDTIRVKIENPPAGLLDTETIRLIGVDTPETKHPNKPVERFGKEAAAFTRSFLQGKTVFLAFDWDLRDAYKRLLAYVYVEGSCFNSYLILKGYAYAYVKYPFQFMEEFKQYEKQARSNKAGLWAE